MPFSSDTFDGYITTLIEYLQPATVLDIGPGAGKYVDMLRPIAKQHDFSTHITGVEIDPMYIEKFHLNERYDDLIVGDAVNLINTPKVRYDLVMIGDCIEHMRKSSAIDLLNFLVYRSGYICIVYPEAFVQDDWHDHPAEAHISTWHETDFKGWDTIHREWNGMNLFLIKGYQPSKMVITG